MSAVRISISINNEMLNKIDRKRGLIPRSTYIQNLLGKSIERGSK